MSDYKALLALAPIAAGLAQGKIEVAQASMMGIHPETGRVVLEERAFQWFPESFSDNIEIGWEAKQVPGSSHAIMQWSGNGGRTFSFETLLYRNMAPLALQKQQASVSQLAVLTPSVVGSDALFPDPSSEDNAPYNINIESMVSWFRAFCYPTYVKGQGFGSTTITRPISPPIAILNLPKMALNEDGSDIVYCVVTGCDVTYEKLFATGQPKVVKVNLTLKQVVQNPRAANAIQFVGFDTLRQAREKKFDANRNRYGAAPKSVALDQDLTVGINALGKIT
jgi:hypothetical protein